MLRNPRVAPPAATLPLLLTTLLALLGWALAAAPPAGAANVVTVGADLSEPLFPVGACETANGCGLFPLTATSPSSGTAAPFGGTVTAWRIGGASKTAGYTVSVLRGNADGTYTVTASSAPVTPAGGGGIETFTADLPIAAGEFVAVDVPEGGTISILASESHLVGFAGPLKAGETLTPFEEEELGITFAFDADIEASPPPASPPSEPSTSSSASSTSSSSPSPAAPSPAPVAEGPHCVVPKLAGKKPAAAKRALRRADCGVGLVFRDRSRKGAAGKGAKVLAQSPKPGRSLPAGTEVSLKFG